jgi:hypothetical protein
MSAQLVLFERAAARAGVTAVSYRRRDRLREVTEVDEMGCAISSSNVGWQLIRR